MIVRLKEQDEGEIQNVEHDGEVLPVSPLEENLNSIIRNTLRSMLGQLSVMILKRG